MTIDNEVCTTDEVTLNRTYNLLDPEDWAEVIHLLRQLLNSETPHKDAQRPPTPLDSQRT
ncbi:MAG TPA: hypothetical protein VHL58_05545 [Thermoanaerobaculia bacterium]|nr:hypothetical protein [Thermoanaerobaculia bacterium]